MRYAVRLLAAVLLTGVGLLIGPVAGEADAAVCSSDTGVTVVVDFSKVGGGVVTTCVEGGGGDSASQLLEVSHDLTRDQQYPGVVCQVDGAPADAECRNMPPANAYWGLFWSDGHGGWTYSSQGVDSLDVPAGGSVGMAWQDGGSNDAPGAAPPQHASSQPSPHPSSSPSSKPSGGGGGTSSGGSSGSASGAASGPATTSATSRPSDTPTSTGPRHHATKVRHDPKPAPRKHHHSEHSSSPSPSAEASSAEPMTEATAPTSNVVEPDDSGGMPGWIPLAAIGLLFVTAAGAGVVRHRRS